jgi:hypothetical protein
LPSKRTPSGNSSWNALEDQESFGHDGQWGTVALTFGSLYFLTMVARLVLGVTLLRHQRCFASPIPTIFHRVLAEWVLLWVFHRVHGEERLSGR